MRHPSGPSVTLLAPGRPNVTSSHLRVSDLRRPLAVERTLFLFHVRMSLPSQLTRRLSRLHDNLSENWLERVFLGAFISALSERGAIRNHEL